MKDHLKDIQKLLAGHELEKLTDEIIDQIEEQVAIVLQKHNIVFPPDVPVGILVAPFLMLLVEEQLSDLTASQRQGLKHIATRMMLRSSMQFNMFNLSTILDQLTDTVKESNGYP